MTKVTTVRIDDDVADRKSDPQFRELLEKDREVIERLAAGLAA